MNYNVEIFLDNVKNWFINLKYKLKKNKKSSNTVNSSKYESKKSGFSAVLIILLVVIFILSFLLIRSCSQETSLGVGSETSGGSASGKKSFWSFLGGLNSNNNNGSQTSSGNNNNDFYGFDENGNLIGKPALSKKSYDNAIKLAKKYADKGDYDRALSLLEELLIQNPEDEKVREMFDKVLDGKRKSEDEKGSSISVDMNTDGLSSELQKAMQNALDLQAQENQKALERALSEGNRQASESQKALEKALSESQKQAAQNQKALADLMEKQAAQAAQQAAQDEIKKQEEAERREAEKAAELQRKAEEEKRRKAEEELAKKNAKLKSEIEAVNEQIRLGKASLNSGDADGAAAYFQAARSLLPVSGGEPEFSASKESEMAMALYEAAGKSGDKTSQSILMKEAVKAASNALATNPKDASSNFILGSDALNNRDLNKAMDYFKKAVMYDPNNYLYFYNLGKVQYSLKKYAEAQSSFNSSCRLKDDFTPSRFNLGLTYVMLKNESQALNSFRKTIDIDPRYEKAYQEEARILKKRGDFAGAIASYKKAIDINNTNDTYYSELGSVYYASGKMALAEESYRRALALIESDDNKRNRVNYPRITNNLSTALYDQEKYSEALVYAKKTYDLRDLVRDEKEKASMIYNYALLVDRNGNTDDAIIYYSEVLKFDPNHIKTNINLGVIYMGLTPPDAQHALALFQKVYELDSTNFEANNNLGSAYVELEKYESAVKHYQAALKLDPKNNDVRYNLAKAYAKIGDVENYNNAKLVYQDLLKQDPKHWNGYLDLAKICLTLNDNTGAEKYLIYLQEKNPSFKASEVQALLDGITP